MATGDVRVNPQTGQTYELQKSGNASAWVEIEGDKAAAAQTAAQAGTPGAFVGGVAQGLSFGGLSDNPVMQAQQRQSPNAVLAGEVSTILAPLLPGLNQLRGAQGLVKGAKAADRVTSGIEAGSQRITADRLIRRPSNKLGGQGTTAGSAARIIEAGVDSVPGLNLLGLGQRAFNRRLYNESFARSMGVSDEVARSARGGITPPVRKAIRDEFEQEFRVVFDAVGDTADQMSARALLETGREAGWIKKSTFDAMQNRKITGSDLKDIRENFSKVLRNNNETQAAKNAAEEMIEQTDDVITKALGEQSEELMERYAQTRARWRVWRQARTGRGLSADNQVNPISMDGRLRSQAGIGDSYGAGEPLANAPQELNDFLELMRTGATLETGLQSSGTAERLIGVGALGGAGAALLGN